MDSPFLSTYFWVSVVLSTPLLIYLIYLNVVAARNRPKIWKSDIIFEEWFASGNSLKNFLTQLGGARNCLRVVVTKDLLWVTSWFPFSLIAAFYDLEHVIPRNRISKIETNSDEVFLTYVSENGGESLLRLAPRKMTSFLSALNKT